jgi:hypothetical protein
MNTRYISNALVAFCTIACINSCKPEGTQQELITTVKLNLTPTSTGAVKTFTFTDKDGNGPNAPVYFSDTLAAGSSYQGTAIFEDESGTSTVDITAEIVAEGADHQIFYESAPSSLLAITYLASNADANGKPIGNKFTAVASNTPGNGLLRVTLRHKPDKAAALVSNGNIANAGGETDVEINLPIFVQ